MSNDPIPPINPAPPDEPGHVSARVPEKISRGVFSTGQIVLDTPKEFMVDFLQSLARPMQVVARLVLTPSTMHELITALRQNLEMYSQRFGPPAPVPPPPNDRRPTIEEVYANLKLPEEMMAGQYANSVLITHSPTEFAFDFIAGFYPNPAVSARVFLPAQQAPRFLQMLVNASAQHHQRFGPPPTGQADATPPQL